MDVKTNFFLSQHYLNVSGQLKVQADLPQRKNSRPYWDLGSSPLVIQPVTSRYTECATTALWQFFYWAYTFDSEYRSIKFPWEASECLLDNIALHTKRQKDSYSTDSMTLKMREVLSSKMSVDVYHITWPYMTIVYFTDSVRCLHLPRLFLGLLFDSEDEGTMILWNIGTLLVDCRAFHSRKQHSWRFTCMVPAGESRTPPKGTTLWLARLTRLKTSVWSASS
jgi:hypothetical protein